MTLHFALRNGWELVRLYYDAVHALVERQRADGLRERALAHRVDDRDASCSTAFCTVGGVGSLVKAQPPAQSTDPSPANQRRRRSGLTYLDISNNIAVDSTLFDIWVHHPEDIP
jgi:hypothetical protein